MAYHEAFWVVVGTAAPVLALTSSVATAGVMEIGEVLPRRRPAPQERSMDETRQTVISAAKVAYLVAAGGFFLDLAVLILALISLGRDADALPTFWGGYALGASFVVVFMQGLVSAAAKGLAKTSRFDDAA